MGGLSVRKDAIFYPKLGLEIVLEPFSPLLLLNVSAFFSA